MLRVNGENVESELRTVHTDGGAVDFEGAQASTPRSVVVSEGWNNTPRHFTVLQDGIILQHADTHKTVKGKDKGQGEVKVLILRPDEPRPPWSNAVGVAWSKKQLVLPTWEQMEALVALVQALTAHAGVPLVFGTSATIRAASPLTWDGFASVGYLQLRLLSGRDLTGAAQGLVWLLTNTKPPVGGGWESLAALVVGSLLVAGGAHVAKQGKFPMLKGWRGGR